MGCPSTLSSQPDGETWWIYTPYSWLVHCDGMFFVTTATGLRHPCAPTPHSKVERQAVAFGIAGHILPWSQESLHRLHLPGLRPAGHPLLACVSATWTNVTPVHVPSPDQ